MLFLETKIRGAYVVEAEKIEDERGFFARAWCRKELEERGLDPGLAQASVSFNKRKGTLRGMHFQALPHQETKLVRCTRGSIYDVILDLRPGEATLKQWVAVELSAQNHRMLYIPQGVAHGFQTLEDDTEVFYLISEFHAPECARGVRWNDPAFVIRWPDGRRIISERDQRFPDYEEGIADRRDGLHR